MNGMEGPTLIRQDQVIRRAFPVAGVFQRFYSNGSRRGLSSYYSDWHAQAARTFYHELLFHVSSMSLRYTQSMAAFSVFE